MQRRTFLTCSLASATLGAIPASALQDAQGSSDGRSREFYELRRYQLANGPQKKICDDYFKDALLPAVNRFGITPVGVFNLAVGAETPAMYLPFSCRALRSTLLLPWKRVSHRTPNTLKRARLSSTHQPPDRRLSV
jgi:hypothetical protein